MEAERIGPRGRHHRRLLGIPIAPKIGRDDREILREPWRNPVPGKMVERVAVHQQNWRPMAAMHCHNART